MTHITNTLPPLPEPAAHMYPSDLEKFKTSETFAHAYSVAVGNPDERSVPLVTLSDCLEYAALAQSAQAPAQPAPSVEAVMALVTVFGKRMLRWGGGCNDNIADVKGAEAEVRAAVEALARGVR